MKKDTNFIDIGKKTILLETEAIKALVPRINSQFTKACHTILNCKGRLVVTGMGKSGHIAKKIAATFASTGTPSFFIHPGEASHGDMGMITNQDVVLILSNSGETKEILILIPIFKRIGINIISLTGNPKSTLATFASIHMDVSVKQEACPLDLAPTSSTTAALVMGDALATALLDARDFTKEDFAFSHPGGKLGRRLLLKVKDIMHTGKKIPIVKQNTTLSDALLEITEKGLGMTSVINEHGKISGIFTDGDLRRILDKKINLNNTFIQEVMTKNCLTINPNILVTEALKTMEDHKINALICVENQQIIGAINMHDLLKSGVI